MTHPDLEPATRRLSALVADLRDDQLGDPTPCPDYRLGDLVDHVGGLAVAFTAAAGKATGGTTGQAPSGDAARLGSDWRARIPRDLGSLAEAWRRDEAWTGMTEAGGVALPGEIAGLVALDEVVVHGWDIARASGRPFDCDPALLEALHGFLAPMAEPGQEGTGGGLFGPPVPVGPDAPLLDRVIALTGRDPAWSPA